jgi:hypothetical protein
MWQLISAGPHRNIKEKEQPMTNQQLSSDKCDGRRPPAALSSDKCDGRRPSAALSSDKCDGRRPGNAPDGGRVVFAPPSL